MRRIGGSFEGVSVVIGGSAGFTAARLVAALGWGEVVVVVAMVESLLANSNRPVASYILEEDKKKVDDDANKDPPLQPRIAYRTVHNPSTCSGWISRN